MSDQHITLIATETPNLDTLCLRGSAPLAQLAVISQADVYDQVTNPDGLQRDLSKKHATEAYKYAAKDPVPALPRAFPEVVLNVRDKKVLGVEKHEVDVDGHTILVVKLTFDLPKILNAKTVKVSRVDGNHRLFYGAGDGKDLEALSSPIPFQIHVGLTREQEAELFLDINSEQKGLNTSHLHVMRTKLTPEDIELQFHPERVFAMRLATDESSPWNQLVHMGGSKAGSKEQGIKRPVTFTALESGIRTTIRKSQFLSDLTSAGAQYEMIRRYWQAVQQAFPEEWANHTEYLVLKHIGVKTFSLVAANVIDRCMSTNDVERDTMEGFLKAAKTAVDWHKDSPDVAGRSGHRAERLLAAEMLAAAGLVARIEDDKREAVAA